MANPLFFRIPPAPSADLRPELAPALPRASRVPADGDRESGIRLAGSLRHSEQLRGASLPHRDSESRDLPPLVRDVTEPLEVTLAPRVVALSMIVLFAGVALGAWTAAVTGAWP